MTRIQKEEEDGWKVRVTLEPLPEDVDIYNSWDIDGYYLNISNAFPEYDASPCRHEEAWLNNKSATWYTMSDYCEDYQMYYLDIAAYNHLGIGVMRRYCFIPWGYGKYCITW